MLNRTQRQIDKLQNIVKETIEDVADERKKMKRENQRIRAEEEIADKKKSMQLSRKNNNSNRAAQDGTTAQSDKNNRYRPIIVVRE